MIRINLLPEAAGKKPGRRPAAAGAAGGGGNSAGGLVIGMLGLVLFGVAGAIFVYSGSQVREAQGRYDKTIANQKRLNGEINKLSDKAKEIQGMMELFSKQYEVLQALDPPDSILWSEKVNMIAELMPKDVFLTDIKIVEETREVQTEASIKAVKEWEDAGKTGDKPEVIKKPIVTYTMTLAGLASGADNKEQFANVLNFEQALQKYESKDNWGRPRQFMQYFNTEIGIEFIEATLYEQEYPVNRFNFVLRTIPVTSVEKKPEDGAAAPAKPAN